eukprot:scaffold4085_cov113-Isochrysis_galbana.AAC.4
MKRHSFAGSAYQSNLIVPLRDSSPYGVIVNCSNPSGRANSRVQSNWRGSTMRGVVGVKRTRGRRAPGPRTSYVVTVTLQNEKCPNANEKCPTAPPFLELMHRSRINTMLHRHTTCIAANTC